MVRLGGVRVIETNVGAGTVTIVEPVTPVALAVTVAVPCASVVANPLSLASLLTADTLVADELHNTEDKT